MKSPTSLLFCSLLLALSFNANADFKDISRIYRAMPSLQHFEICHSGGCAEISQLSLSDEDWQKVSTIFNHKPENAQQERAQIAAAIGVLEDIVGQKIGTADDKAGTFSSANLGQLDCNDEAINTTTYMRLLKQAGFMPLNDIEDTRTRSFFFNGWPHSTAVIHDIKTNERFAVDSWFYDNGHAATVVPLAIWKSGYRPSDSPIGMSTNTNHANVQK
jgi:hypothetical protein